MKMKAFTKKVSEMTVDELKSVIHEVVRILGGEISGRVRRGIYFGFSAK
jgi:hypothetical protein